MRDYIWQVPTRHAILADLLRELRRIDREGVPPRNDGTLDLPILLPIDEGELQLLGSPELLRQIEEYGKNLVAGNPDVRARFWNEDVLKMLRDAFGPALAGADLQEPDDQLIPVLDARVVEDFASRRAEREQTIEITFGTSFLTGPENYTTVLGPVRFESREAWLERLEAAGRVSLPDARRVRGRWAGRRLRKLKGWDRGGIIADAIGTAPFVCTVTTHGQSPEAAKTKALRVARLALTLVALNWKQPSRALEMMRLRPDGTGHHQDMLLFNDDRLIGANSAVVAISVGQWVPDSWADDWRAAAWPQPYADALTALVDSRAPRPRPLTSDALLSALWLFNKGCLEDEPLLATVQYAAALDALGGGDGVRGIVKLIGSRLGIAADSPLFKGDERTVKQIIKWIYVSARSEMVHGTHRQLGEDHRDVRNKAEAISRTLLIHVAYYVIDVPGLDDPSSWRNQ